MFNARNICGAALVFVLSMNAEATLINGDFNDPLSTGWQTIGNVTEQNVSGSNQAVLDTTSSSTNKALINSSLGIDIDAVTTTIAGSGKTFANGSFLYQTFDIVGIGELTFDWNFLTNESGLGAKPDYSFYVLANVTELAQRADTSTPGLLTFSRQSGYASVIESGLTAGTYLLGFGVVNVDNTSNNSGLLVDNVALVDAVPSVPVPATLALLGLGMIGLRRRIIF